MFPGRGRSKRVEVPLDREAQRAQEALRKVRELRAGRAAGADLRGPGTEWRAGSAGDWRDLVRRRRRRKALRWVAAAGLFAGTAALAAGLVFGGRIGFHWLRTHTGLFGIQDIVVSGMDRLTRDEVIAAAGLGLGQDILKVNPDSVAAKVQALPLVRSAEARRTWQRAITLSIVERKPRAAVLLDRMCEVDEEGVVLPPDDAGSVDDLTIVRGLEGAAPPPGRRIVAPGLPHALDLIGIMSRPELGLESAVSEIWASEADSLVMVMMANAVPVRVGRGDIPPRRLMAFRAVLEDLARRKIDPEYLDLRFNGQIVVKPRPEAQDDMESGAGAKGRAGVPVADRRGRRSRHGLNT